MYCLRRHRTVPHYFCILYCTLQYISKAQAAKLVAKRRAEVHERYLKLWAKKLLVAPEAAVVPLKEVDAQLASKFEVGLCRLWARGVVRKGRDCGGAGGVGG